MMVCRVGQVFRVSFYKSTPTRNKDKLIRFHSTWIEIVQDYNSCHVCVCTLNVCVTNNNNYYTVL